MRIISQNPLEIELPIKVISEANSRGHWGGRASRFKKQRLDVRLTCNRAIKPLPDNATAIVTLTRLGKRTLDTDNLSGAFKAIRDEIAAMMGIDDGSERIEWRYRQLYPLEYGIRIKIEICPSRGKNVR